MHLSADKVYADPREDDYPNIVGFHDSSADWCLTLSRFSDLEPDDGTIEVVVRDQINASTANLIVDLTRSQCRVRLDEITAAHLLGIREYIVDFQVDDATYKSMVDLLRIIFEGLPGLTVAV
jgi:hypothetical protein